MCIPVPIVTSPGRTFRDWDHTSECSRARSPSFVDGARRAASAWPRHRVRRLCRLGRGTMDDAYSPMSRLARDNRVLFVESLGLRQPQLAGRDLRRIARRLRQGLAGPRMRDGVNVLSPLVVPLHRYGAVRALNLDLLRFLIRRATRRIGFTRPILWAYVPQAEVLLDLIHPSLVVYHCVDDIAAQPGIDAASFRTAETRFASRADLVLVSAPTLGRRLRTIARNVVDAPNVADTDSFSEAPSPDPRTRLSTRFPRRGSCSPVPSSPRSSTSRCSSRSRGSGRAGPSCWSGRWGPGIPAPTHGLKAEPNIHLLGPRRPPASDGAARSGCRVDPDAQRTHREHLSDEGVRVPRCRLAGGRDGLAGACGGRGGRSVRCRWNRGPAR